jgi:dolichyl-phosphate beta-glucosyltransferase
VGRVTRIATVIPAFNEGAGLSAFLHSWALQALEQSAVIAAIVVVDDGSDTAHEVLQRAGVDRAAGILRSASVEHDIRYVRAPRNLGKGAAIRLGWSQAEPSADWLGFIDGDGAVPAREYWRLANLLPGAAADAVCGSRVKMAGRSVERSMFRHLQGRAFATCVETVFHLGFYDTQCGLKFFRGPLMRPLLPRLREDRWLLDIEVLELLRSPVARFQEVPVDCRQGGGSSLAFGVDPIRMAVRLVSLRRRLRHDVGGPR